MNWSYVIVGVIAVGLISGLLGVVLLQNGGVNDKDTPDPTAKFEPINQVNQAGISISRYGQEALITTYSNNIEKCQLREVGNGFTIIEETNLAEQRSKHELTRKDPMIITCTVSSDAFSDSNQTPTNNREYLVAEIEYNSSEEHYEITFYTNSE